MLITDIGKLQLVSWVHIHIYCTFTEFRITNKLATTIYTRTTIITYFHYIFIQLI